MKSKRNLIISIIQLVIGILAIVAFAVLGSGGENVSKWVITFFLAVAYVILGLIGIADYKSNK